MVHDFKNLSGSEYDYLKEPIAISLLNSLKKIPFFTLTPAQKEKIKDYYRVKAGPDSLLCDIFIRNKLEPLVYRGKREGGILSLDIVGSYAVDSRNKNIIGIWVKGRNNKLLLDTGLVYLKADTDLIIRDNYEIFFPFIKSLLNYRVSTVRVSSMPEDSLIFIDGVFCGLGSTGSLLLPAGIHRIRVIHDGYSDYTEIVNISESYFSKFVELNLLPRKTVLVESIPGGAEVYINEKFVGNTPIEIPYDKPCVLTLKKDGFNDREYFLHIDSKLTSGYSVNLTMVPSDSFSALKQKAERDKKISRVLYYTGLGLVAVSAVLGTQSVLYRQKKELYRNVNNYEYNRAKDLSNILGVASFGFGSTAVITLSFSFFKIYRYFKLYGSEDSNGN